jgi:hypothetical protein
MSEIDLEGAASANTRLVPELCSSHVYLFNERQHPIMFILNRLTRHIHAVAKSAY